MINLPAKYIQLAAAGVGVLVLTWSHWTAHSIGADGVRLEVANQALKQIERAHEQTQQWQEKANEAQQQYNQTQSEIALRDRRIRDLNHRMLNTPSTEQLANLTAATLSTYAAEIDRDFAECRAEYVALGATAAGASAAAWAHRDSWPTLNRESINQDRVNWRKE